MKWKRNQINMMNAYCKPDQQWGVKGGLKWQLNI